MLWTMVFLIGRNGVLDALIAVSVGIAIHTGLVFLQRKHPLAFPILIRRIASGTDELVR